MRSALLLTLDKLEAGKGCKATALHGTGPKHPARSASDRERDSIGNYQHRQGLGQAFCYRPSSMERRQGARCGDERREAVRELAMRPGSDLPERFRNRH